MFSESKAVSGRVVTGKPVTVTASGFAKELGINPKGLKIRQIGRPAIVTGTLTDKKELSCSSEATCQRTRPVESDMTPSEVASAHMPTAEGFKDRTVVEERTVNIGGAVVFQLSEEIKK